MGEDGMGGNRCGVEGVGGGSKPDDCPKFDGKILSFVTFSLQNSWSHSGEVTLDVKNKSNFTLV